MDDGSYVSFSMDLKMKSDQVTCQQLGESYWRIPALLESLWGINSNDVKVLHFTGCKHLNK